MSRWSIGHDLRVAMRGWMRTPGLALVVVLTLGLGIGATTTMFTIVDAALIRPLPYRDAGRLVVVSAERDYQGAAQPVPVPFPSDAVAAWPPQLAGFESVGFYAEGVRALAYPSGSELVNIGIVDGAFFATVGGPMLMGRPIGPGDAASPVAVISARLWRRYFGGEPAVLGRPLTLNGEVFTVVGVAADAFRGPLRQDDAWLTATAVRTTSPRCCGFTPIARMAPGRSLEVGAAEVQAFTQGLASDMPNTWAGARSHVVPLRQAIVGRVTPALLLLTAAATLLLLLAVCNVAGLLLARHSARRLDVAVRRALGASAWQLVRERLAESAWLAIAGSAVGLVMTWASVRLLAVVATEVLPGMQPLTLEASTTALVVAIAAVVTVVVGAAPMVARGAAATSVPSGDRTSTAPPQSRRALNAVTIAQQALSSLLIVGAILLTRSLVALVSTEAGFSGEQVATASINLAMGRTLTSAQQAALVARIVDRASALPEVVAAGAGTSRPPDVSRMRLTLTRGSTPGGGEAYQAAAVPVTPGYFAALGIRLLRGRLFAAADTAAAPEVVILSEATARRLFGERDAIGEHIELPVLRDERSLTRAMTVVGVVGDVKFNGLDRPADDVVYRPFAQQAWVSAFLVVRTGGDPGVMAAHLAKVVAAEDPLVAVSDTRSMDAVLATATLLPRVRTATLAGVSLLALAIASVGLAGVVAYSVSQRQRELAVRMALGADTARITRMVMLEGLSLAASGLLLGLAGALAGSRLLSSVLYGVAATDERSFVLTALVCLAASAVGCYLPSRRAARTDPASALRA